MSKYLADLKPYFKQTLPKKIVVSRRIRVNPKYECTVTFWIPDIPYSKNPPGLGMTMRHGHGEQKEFLRLVFTTTEDLKEFTGQFNQFVLDNIIELNKVLRDALLEWEAYRLKVKKYKESKVDNVNSLTFKEEVPS
jgi:hypothetical protein